MVINDSKNTHKMTTKSKTDKSISVSAMAEFRKRNDVFQFIAQIWAQPLIFALNKQNTKLSALHWKCVIVFAILN